MNEPVLQWADADGARLPYVLRRHATSPHAPLVFVHAGVCDHRMWLAQLESFATERTVLAYDRRGFGRSQTLSITPHRWVDDLWAVMDAGGLQRAVLVGCSQGGRIALDAVLARPERVAALVLVAPAVGGAPTPQLTGRSAELQDEILRCKASGDLDALNHAFAALWLDGPFSEIGRVGGAARELFLDMDALMLKHGEVGEALEPAQAAWAQLERIAAPAQVVWGDLDLPHLQQQGQILAQRMPHAQACVLPGVAHLPSLEAPEAFNAALRGFLSQIERR